MKPRPRLSFDPIDRLLLAEQLDRTGTVYDLDTDYGTGGDRLACEDVGRRIGPIVRYKGMDPAEPTVRMVRSWRRCGVDPWLADRIASALGWPPSLLWDEWEDVIDDLCHAALTRQRGGVEGVAA